MSQPTPEGVREEIRLAGLEYAKVLAGTNGFTKVKVTGVPTTASTVFDITASSSLTPTATNSMYHTLVAGTGYTTFTKTGAIRVTITDSAGNLVNGDHYIQIGSLT